jgi:hypothetical protein
MLTLAEVRPSGRYTINVWRGDETTPTGRISCYDPVEITVLRCGRKKVRIQFASGAERWVYPCELRLI